MAKRNNKKTKSEKNIEKKVIEQPVDINIGDDKILEDMKTLSLMSEKEVDENIESTPIVEGNEKPISETETQEEKVEETKVEEHIIESAEPAIDENEEEDLSFVDKVNEEEVFVNTINVEDIKVGDNVKTKDGNNYKVIKIMKGLVNAETTENEDVVLVDFNGKERKIEVIDIIEVIKEIKEQPQRRMTYEEMFGYTWMGY